MKNKSDLIFPHDRLFKEIWSHSENARDFFENYLPKDLLKTINLESLELQKGSFVEKDLKEYHSDLLYKVKTSTGHAFVYILFEHKSYPEGLIHLQLLKYMTGIWSLSFKQDKTKKFSPIVPLVLYHGRKQWSVPLLFSGMFDVTEKPIASYIPDFRYLLHDLSKYSDEEIKGTIIIRLVTLLFKYISDPAFEEKLPEIVRLLYELSQNETCLQYIETLLKYIASNKKNIELEKFMRVMEETIAELGDEGGDVMSFAKTIIGQSYNKGLKQGDFEGMQKGLQKGLQKGMQKGLQKGLQKMIIEFFEFRFGNTEHLETIKREIKSIDSIERLESIKNAVKKCAAPDEIISMLGN